MNKREIKYEVKDDEGRALFSEAVTHTTKTSKPFNESQEVAILEFIGLHV